MDGSKRRKACVGAILLWAFGVVAAVRTTAGTWRDDFDAAGLRDWTIYNFDRGVESWDAKDGQAIGQIELTDFYSLLILSPRTADAERWRDYSVRCRANMLRVKRQNAEPRMGISLYDQENAGNRYLCLLAFDSREVHLVRVTQDAWQVIPVVYPAEPNVWYELSASIQTEADRERLTFRVNDDFEFSVTAVGPLKTGKVGLVVSDGRAAFDDVEVSGASVPNGGPGKARPVSPRGLLATTWAAVRMR
jgi:hypothetical protein